MRKLALLLLLVSSIAFAAAGFADAYNDHQRWIFSAYTYSLVFGLIALVVLFIKSLIYQIKTQHISEHISVYLIRHKILAIVCTGILLAVPIGIIGAVSWEIIYDSYLYSRLWV